MSKVCVIETVIRCICVNVADSDTDTVPDLGVFSNQCPQSGMLPFLEFTANVFLKLTPAEQCMS